MRDGDQDEQQTGRPATSEPTAGPANPGTPAVTPAANAAAIPDGPTGAAEPGDGLVACTIATSADLPWVRVLRQSYRVEHPGARFVTLLVDVAPSDGWDDVITPADIGVSELDMSRLATAYTGAELRAVLRPVLLERLLADGRPVLALDPRVLIFGSLTELVTDALAKAPLALLPRATDTLPADGLRPTPDELHAAGTFAPDLLAVGHGAEPFLRSWAQRLRAAPDAVGSRLAAAATVVDHHLLRDEGLGVSVWNAAHRELWCPEGEVLHAGRRPVRSVHFDGFDPRRPWLLSADFADRPRVLLSEHPLLAELCAGYHTELVRAGYTEVAEPDRFAALPDGTPLPQALRTAYRVAWLDGGSGAEPVPPPAVGPAADPAGFLAWAGDPADDAQRAAGLSRWAVALWASDPALRAAYPDPYRADAAGFRAWCAETGVAQGRLPADSVPTGPRSATRRTVDQLGVTVSGAGPIADALRLAVRASGLPCAEDALYPVVLHACPTEPPPADRYAVAVCTEVAGPVTGDGWAERWTPSAATAALIGRSATANAHALRLPVAEHDQAEPAERAAIRADLGVDDGFVFAALVDHRRERSGNALGAVAAFGKAFPDREGVQLVFFVRGAAANPEAAERLRLATAADHRIRLIEDGADTDVRPLLVVADCVLALHRADPATGGDDLALTLLDATARGLPVLASEHGAVAEHFGDNAGLLVRCPQPGEPDLAAAAELMRDLVDDPEAAARLGAAGRHYVRQEWSASACSPALRALVEQGYRAWRSRRSPMSAEDVDDPLRPLLAAKHALLRRPDVDVSSRIPMAPALRKGVLRVLNHYDAHLRDVLRTMVDGMERTATELVRRQDEVGGPVDDGELRAELDRLTARLDRFAEQVAGADDGVLRIRSELAGQGRQLRALEEQAPATAQGQRQHVDALADRLDRLTVALDRTLDRIDGLERRVAENFQDRDSRLEAGVRAASQSIRVSDALSRVVLREHERQPGAEPGGAATSLVLSDAGLLRLPAEDVMMLPWLSTHGVWEPELAAFMDSLLEPEGIFLDVGAHIGYHTIRVLSRLGTSGAVVAVEPAERERELLRHNVSVNVSEAAAGQLTVIGAAAWDTAGELRATPALAGGVEVRPATAADPDPDPDGVAGAQPDAASPSVEVSSPAGRELFTPQQDGPPLSVSAVRLDQAIEAEYSLHGRRLSVVKVDVPGRGHRALGGMVRLLRRDRPNVLCSFSPTATAELGDDPAAALREFNTWGYEIVPLGEDVAIAPDRVLDAVQSAGPGATATLWLRPKGRRE